MPTGRRLLPLFALTVVVAPGCMFVLFVGGLAWRVLGGWAANGAVPAFAGALVPLAIALCLACRWWPARSRALESRLAYELELAGGDPHPSLPLVEPATEERLAQSGRLLFWQDCLWEHMRDPGRGRSLLLGFALWYFTFLSTAAIGSMAKSGVELRSWAFGLTATVAVALSVVVVLLAADLRRGRRRSLSRPWHIEPAGYAPSWPLQRPPPRLLSPPLALLQLLLLAVAWLGMHQSSFELVVAPVLALAALWSARHTLLRSPTLERLEHACVRTRLFALETWSAVGLWLLCRAVRASGWVFGGILMPIGLALGLTGSGPHWLLSLSMTLWAMSAMTWILTCDWPRPGRAVMVSGRDIASRLSGTALERRLDGMFAVLAALCVMATAVL